MVYQRFYVYFFSNFTDCRRRWFTRDFMYIFSQISQIVGEDGLPEIVKPKVPVKASDEEKKEFAALFDTDSEEDMDMTER